MEIGKLGYNSFFEDNRISLGYGNLPVARVVSEQRGLYRVKSETSEFNAKITGKQMHSALSREDFPAVGDWVVIEMLDDANVLIRGILPRQTIIKRKYGDRNKTGDKDKIQIIATNIDVAFIVESVDEDYSLNRFERYFAIATDGGVKPVIVLNKTDLLSKEELEQKVGELNQRFSGIDIVLTSTLKNEGLADLLGHISKGRTYCFLGSSGVGKSSLINKLLGEGIIKTGDISSYSGKGRHTTTNRQMYFLENGGIVIDNPGIREVGMTDVSSGIDVYFDEISELGEGCKFTDCKHLSEPGCRVIEAVDRGELDKERYLNYINLRKEAEFYEMNDVEKREKDRQFGKFIKKSMKTLKDLGHKDI